MLEAVTAELGQPEPLEFVWAAPLGGEELDDDTPEEEELDEYGPVELDEDELDEYGLAEPSDDEPDEYVPVDLGDDTSDDDERNFNYED